MRLVFARRRARPSGTRLAFEGMRDFPNVAAALPQEPVEACSQPGVHRVMRPLRKPPAPPPLAPSCLSSVAPERGFDEPWGTVPPPPASPQAVARSWLSANADGADGCAEPPHAFAAGFAASFLAGVEGAAAASVRPALPERFVRYLAPPVKAHGTASHGPVGAPGREISDAGLCPPVVDLGCFHAVGEPSHLPSYAEQRTPRVAARGYGAGHHGAGDP